jgi:hypothetical protein
LIREEHERLYLTGADVFWLAKRARDDYGLAPDRRLEAATLRTAHLEGANLYQGHLEGADLRGARVDETTLLVDAGLGPGALGDWLDRLDRLRNRNVALGDIQWRDVDLTSVPWDGLRRLGDERKGISFNLNAASRYTDVVRAYRQVAQRLRDQGMSDDADRFAFRAQIRQRGAPPRTLRLARYLFSWLLAILAGYGYRRDRTRFWYLVTSASFTLLYMQATAGPDSLRCASPFAGPSVTMVRCADPEREQLPRARLLPAAPAPGRSGGGAGRA